MMLLPKHFGDRRVRHLTGGGTGVERLLEVLGGSGGKRLGETGPGRRDARLHGFAARPWAHVPMVLTNIGGNLKLRRVE